MSELPPLLPFFAGAILLPLIPRAARAWFFLLPPLAALAMLAGLEDGTILTVPFAGLELVPLRVDRLAMVFGWIFSIAAFIGGVYALHLRDTGQQIAALLYVGSALGAIFSGDLFMLFVFWEIMAVASAYLVWARGGSTGYRSGMRYIFVHLFGGSLLLGGILLHYGTTGSLAFDVFTTQTVATWLILLGFALNAAIPPLHAWLADAYPAATVTGAVFLSAFTTKTAVYTLARGFPGWEILIPVGVFMALYGVVYAVLADDIRQLLAYHIVSQVGYMVTGVGLGTEMGINGATGHAFTHILYKGLLFMGAGAVLYATGRSKLSELGALGKYMPWTVALYMVGAFSISGFPFFSGFVSKAVTLEAAELLSHYNVAMLLYLASIGTFLHTGLKLPYFTWFGPAPEQGYDPKPIPWNMIAAMALAAALNFFLGVFPQALYAILPYPLDYQPYTYGHVLHTVQLLAFTFIAFWLLRSRLGGEPFIALDTDWFYRRPSRFAYEAGPQLVARAFGAVERAAYGLAAGIARLGQDPVGRIFGAPAVSSGRGGTDGSESRSTSFRISLGAMILIALACIIGVVVVTMSGPG
ncbi:MAG: Na(+)/H(+) antiporter subunit D [Gemmatimonadota bacterium]